MNPPTSQVSQRPGSDGMTRDTVSWLKDSGMPQPLADARSFPRAPRAPLPPCCCLAHTDAESLGLAGPWKPQQARIPQMCFARPVCFHFHPPPSPTAPIRSMVTWLCAGEARYTMRTIASPRVRRSSAHAAGRCPKHGQPPVRIGRNRARMSCVQQTPQRPG